MSTKIVSRARNFTRHYSVLRDFVYNLFARKSVDSTKNFKMTAYVDTLPSRGALIVFEGCDRSGKTTQCSKLEKSLQEKGHCVKLMKFPDRTTVIGKMIDDYLSCKKDVDDHAVHLLFSANRWENVKTLKKLLYGGTTVLVDRYAFSGVAFTAAKEGFSIDWCKCSDMGLPHPDIVLYLTLSSEAAAKRGGFGVERYEQTEFQKKVAENFEKLQDKDWRVIDADKSVEDLHLELQNICVLEINNVANKTLGTLWTDTEIGSG